MQIEQKKPMVRIEKATRCLGVSPNAKDCFHLGPLNLEIKDGELLAVVGPSGSGKTTLLRLIAGLDAPRNGSMTIDGQMVFSANFFLPPEKRRVGMVFQDHALFPHMTVEKNILFGLNGMKLDQQKSVLENIGRLLDISELMKRFPHELSGGQQQRVALARSMAQNPKVILLDEPLSNIDADLRSSLAQELRNVIKQAGITAVWVTHDQGEALDLADRIIVLNNGRIEQIDTPWNLYNNPKTRFVADFIGHASFIKGVSKGELIETEVGDVTFLPCLTDSTEFEVMIRPDDVKAKIAKDGKGKVCKRQFLGAIQTYTICLPSGQHILTNQPAHIDWPIGTRLDIELDVRSVVAFPLN